MHDNFPCPCCGHRTLAEAPGGTYDICAVCFWEDDGVQLDDPDYSGGANVPSLREAQRNYEAYGACDEAARQHVRPPTTSEQRSASWAPLPQN